MVDGTPYIDLHRRNTEICRHGWQWERIAVIIGFLRTSDWHRPIPICGSWCRFWPRHPSPTNLTVGSSLSSEVLHLGQLSPEFDQKFLQFIVIGLEKRCESAGLTGRWHHYTRSPAWKDSCFMAMSTLNWWYPLVISHDFSKKHIYKWSISGIQSLPAAKTTKGLNQAYLTLVQP